MNLNLFNTAILAAVTLLICNANIEEVQANPLAIERNGQQSGIYSDNIWNNNDETEYSHRNTWIIDLNESNRRDETNDCRNGRSGCNNQAEMMEMPIKKEMTPSRGWGAGGMPFNILYMKNPKPSKTMRSQLLTQPQPAVIGIIAEPLRSQPLIGPVPQAQQQYEYPTGYKDAPEIRNDDVSEITQRSKSLINGALSIRNLRPKGRSSNNSLFVPSRRHYSIIPQLFVSYGWGPIGK